MKTPNVLPYRIERGRQSYFIYHPRQTPNMDFEGAKKTFDENLSDAIAVAEVYNESMPNQPVIFNEGVKREIQTMLGDIVRERDIYMLEALAECLYSGADGVGYRQYKGLPYYSELKNRANELRALDSGLVLAGSGSKIILPH